VDWLANGGTAEALCALIDESAEYVPLAGDEEPNWTPADSQSSDGRKTQSQLVIELAEYAGDKFWHTPVDEPYVTVLEQRKIHVNVHSPEYRRLIARRFYRQRGKALGAQPINDALSVLSSRAIYDGPEHVAHLRVADTDDALYVDLADDNGEAVRVTADGWEIALPPDDILFRRPTGMESLCRPIRGQSLDLFRQFVNVANDDNWTLLVAWMLAAFRSVGPYPVLVLQGQQGSAKSTLVRFLSSLIDPSTSPLRSLPRDERDFFIGANNAYLLSFDNVSLLRDWQSDAFCKIATGGGCRTRALYTDAEEKIFDAQRPTILNGIESFVTRGDLRERSLTVECPAIPDNARRNERSLNEDFRDARPGILGALLDAVSGAMRHLPDVRIDALPRMADFACWASAAEPSLGWAPGTFLRAYNANRMSAIERAVEYDPVAHAIWAFTVAQQEWHGTVGALLTALSATPEEVRDRYEWPASPRKLLNHLKRIEPDLLRMGVRFESLGRSNTGRQIRLTVTGAPGQHHEGLPW
jgi:hypothetical protein